MGDASLVEVAEVLAVVRQYGSAVHVCGGRHLLIGNSPTRLTRFSRRQYVVAQAPQGFYGRVGEVLVCVKAGQ